MNNNTLALWTLQATKQELEEIIDTGEYYWKGPGRSPLALVGKPFTRSNGSVMATIYERLTKASRRRASGSKFFEENEAAYRRGVYDALQAIAKEL